MSGIVGIIHLNGETVDPSLLSRMTDFMSFRGPDAQQIWHEGNIGLGHTLLRTTWEAEYEQQPFTLDRFTNTPDDQQVWIVADARIDDRETLAEKLGIFPLPSPPFTSESKVITDVELILRAYLHWGDDCVQHLLGDFAFAIWDARHQRLFCARDQFGVKPFYYSQVGNCLLISNTMNCLRQHPQVSSELNDRAIGDFLMFETNYDLNTTTFADIQRLPAAHILTWTSERGLRIGKYWTLPLPKLIRYDRDRDYLEHFQELIGKAVGDRLRLEKISSFFSGGLDSTTIAATALALAKQRSQPLSLQAFTVVYDNIIPDREREYADLAANALGIPIDYQVSDDYYPYQNSIEPQFQTPEPLHHPFHTSSYESFNRASLYSRVVLNGQGSDEAFTPTKVTEMFQTMPWRDVLSDVGSSGFVYGVRPNWGSGLLAFVRRGQQPHLDENDCPNWLAPNFAKRLNLKDRWQQIMQMEKKSPTEPRYRAYEGFEPQLMASFLASNDPEFVGLPIETRFPFFDLRLVNYLLALPPLPWCVDKMLLRNIMKGVLPDRVRLRPKTPLAGDILLAKGLQQIDRAAVLQMSDRIENYIDIDRLLAVRDPVEMWNTWQHLLPISLAYWLNRYLDLTKSAIDRSPIYLPNTS